jgi:hypothetical protein
LYTRVVYTAESIALATLEILAGGAPISLLDDFIKISVEFDDSSILPLDSQSAPSGRRETAADWESREILC